MPLSLTAEQKSILKIFRTDEQYVVPAYQRPYSWEYDQCFQLYNDLILAFKANEDYFIGNIITAKSDEDKEILEIIDGQQRLITILLLIKILSLFPPEITIYEEILWIKDWEGNTIGPKIKSEIFEAEDGKSLTSVLKYSRSDFENRLADCIDKNGKLQEKRCRNKFERNSLHFYNWFSFFQNQNSNSKKFISFLLKKIYLLPIQLEGRTRDEANEKALVIFETINNRGMNLEDADIFKAKLYEKAKKIDEQEIFIDLWIEFKQNCDNLNLEIDDIFRYYSHIIRGKAGITSSEINLREFFTREDVSPFEKRKYQDILDDLFKITELLKYFNDFKISESRLSKWIQLIDIYSNQYPKYALISYLFKNGKSNEIDLENFLKSIIRYVYNQGSTSSVKFEIYSIIKKVYSNQKINDYTYNLGSFDFEYLGRLKSAFALLAFYCEKENSLSHFQIDRILTYRDTKFVRLEWGIQDIDEFLDQVGNFVVLDIRKRSVPLEKKKELYSNSKLEEVKKLLINGFSMEAFQKRNDKKVAILISFFKGEV